MKKQVVVLLTITLLMTSCQFDSLKIIHHEKPDIETDFSPFQNIGCDRKKTKVDFIAMRKVHYLSLDVISSKMYHYWEG